MIGVALVCASCHGMYDDIYKHATDETVYTGSYDYAQGKIGYERVEIDLLKAGRIPSDQINLGKAQKTLIEYDDQKISIDSVCSWVSITNLPQQKLYRFRIYTIDEGGHQSVPVEAALVPYTSTDKNALVIPDPRITYSLAEATVNWNQDITSTLLTYYGLKYTYTDKDGTARQGTAGSTPARPTFTVGNLAAGQQVTVNVEYKVIPKVQNVAIIDTLWIERSLILKMP
jgi:hypothetical protein